jgi:NADPH-dependent curcumin reductase CurA
MWGLLKIAQLDDNSNDSTVFISAAAGAVGPMDTTKPRLDIQV